MFKKKSIAYKWEKKNQMVIIIYNSKPFFFSIPHIEGYSIINILFTDVFFFISALVLTPEISKQWYMLSFLYLPILQSHIWIWMRLNICSSCIEWNFINDLMLHKFGIAFKRIQKNIMNFLVLKEKNYVLLTIIINLKFKILIFLIQQYLMTIW